MTNILPFDPLHADGVVRLILPIQQSEFHIPISLEDQPDLHDIPAFYQKGNGNFWVALDDQKVVGTVGLLDIGNEAAALRKMFVAATHRGVGQRVAVRLLDAVVAWCHSKGTRQVYLGTTEKFLAAHRFYEKHGFRQIASAELPVNFPIMTVDTRFYARAFSAGEVVPGF